MNIQKRAKCVLIGDAGVGKSSIMQKITNNTFTNIESTLGASYYQENIHETCLDFWDTAGQERYRSLIPMYLKNAFLIFVVFDLNYRQSFDSLKYWFNTIKYEDAQIVLIGNKYDLKKNILNEDINNLIYKIDKDISYVEISCKNGYNFDDLKKIIENKCELMKFKKHDDSKSVILEEKSQKSCCSIN